jgi:benzodiazapine receptor
MAMVKTKGVTGPTGVTGRGKRSRMVVGIIGTVIIAVYAFGSGRLVTTDRQWYRTLKKPAWQPPGYVTSLIWLYNFGMLFAASWIVASRLSTTYHLVWLICLALSVASALTWAWYFFVPHLFLECGVALLLATLFTIPLLVISFRTSRLLGIAFVPYQLWLALATSLAFGYYSEQ